MSCSESYSSDSRYESSHMDGKRNKEPSLLDHLTHMIDHSLGLYSNEESVTSSSLGEDSRNDGIDEALARYEKSIRPMEKTNETRVDPEADVRPKEKPIKKRINPEDDEEQLRLRMIYEKQQQEKKKKKQNGSSIKDELDEDDMNLDDLSLGAPSSCEEETTSYRSSSPTPCLKPAIASALKKSQKKKSKKKLFQPKPVKKSVSFDESVENELQGRWLDKAVGEIAAELNPYLTEMRKVYVNEMDAHDLVAEEKKENA